MSREMILIPKQKYDRLLQPRQDENNDAQHYEDKKTELKPTQQNKQVMQTKPFNEEPRRVEEHHHPVVKPAKNNDSFIKRKPSAFLAPKRTMNSTKQKWLSFKI